MAWVGLVLRVYHEATHEARGGSGARVRAERGA
jgi:hypothetical protein